MIILEVGNSKTFNATCCDDNDNDLEQHVTCEIQDTGIASVTADGCEFTVTGLSNGHTHVIITSPDGFRIGQDVIVRPAGQATSITISEI